MKIPWFTRKAAKVHENAPESGTAAKRSLIEQLVQILLPIAVLGLFGWWYAAIPPYRAPALPSDWTPGCPQWEAEWSTKTVDSSPGDAAGLEIMGVLPGARHLLIDSANADSIQGSTELLDATSGAVLREVKMPLRWLPCTAEEGLLIADPHGYTRSTNVITEHDPLTFEVLRERTLQCPADVTPAGIMFVTAASLAAGPAGSIYGVGVIGHDPQNQNVSYWFQADRDGVLLQQRRLGKLVHTSDTAMSLPGRYCFMDEELTPGCIDLATGQPVATPSLPSHEGETIRGWESPTLGRIPHGWQQVPLTVSPNEGPRITPLVIEPILLAPPRSKYDDSGERDDRSGFSRARYSLWVRLHGEDAINERRLAARRIAALDLRVDALGIDHRLLTGDVAESLAHQAVRLSQAFDVSHEMVRFGFSFGSAESLCMPLVVHPLNDGRVLVSQFVAANPDAGQNTTGLLRVGLLPTDASEVQWLGWLPLTEDQASRQAGSTSPSYYRAGDQLLIWFPGYVIYRAVGSTKPSHSRPLSWTFIPLPAELAKLPEGPLP